MPEVLDVKEKDTAYYFSVEPKYRDLFTTIEDVIGFNGKQCFQESIISFGQQLGLVKSRNDFLVNGISRPHKSVSAG